MYGSSWSVARLGDINKGPAQGEGSLPEPVPLIVNSRLAGTGSSYLLTFLIVALVTYFTGWTGPDQIV